MRMNPEAIGFRLMTPADLPLMHEWLSQEFVYAWYEKRPFSVEDVQAKFLPRVTGEQPTRCFFITHDGRPIGYIQTYRMVDYPDYNRQVGMEEDAAGLDLFIGHPDYIHKGLGKHILTRFMDEVVFKMPGITKCCVGPEPENAVAIRAYEKAGFRHLKTASVDGELEYIMVATKEATRDE